MKYLIVLLIFFSCTPKKAVVVQTKVDTVVVHDTIIVRDTVFIKDTSMSKKLYNAKHKIEKVRYYLKICQRRPSQTKFLVSWINRAIQ